MTTSSDVFLWKNLFFFLWKFLRRISEEFFFFRNFFEEFRRNFFSSKFLRRISKEFFFLRNFFEEFPKNFSFFEISSKKEIFLSLKFLRSLGLVVLTLKKLRSNFEERISKKISFFKEFSKKEKFFGNSSKKFRRNKNYSNILRRNSEEIRRKRKKISSKKYITVLVIATSLVMASIITIKFVGTYPILSIAS